MAFSSAVLTLEKQGPVAVLWLDNPKRRNAFGPDFWEDLPGAMAAVAGDPSVRAVVLAARGPAFTVGLDLKTMGPALLQGQGEGSAVQGRLQLYREVKRLQAPINALADCPKPVIAAIHGHCIGAGVDLITACDIRLAAEDASFSVRETKMAIVADLGTLQRLPRIINPGYVAEMVYTGHDVDAHRALQMGLVTGVFADAAALQDAAFQMAGEIAENAPLVVQGAKAVLTNSAGMTTAQSLDYVALWNSAYLQSEDLAEAVTAFFEKRPPSFKGA